MFGFLPLDAPLDDDVEPFLSACASRISESFSSVDVDVSIVDLATPSEQETTFGVRRSNIGPCVASVCPAARRRSNRSRDVTKRAAHGEHCKDLNLADLRHTTPLGEKIQPARLNKNGSPIASGR